MFKKLFERIFGQIGSFINKNLTEEEKKRIRQSPLHRPRPWEKKNARY